MSTIRVTADLEVQEGDENTIIEAVQEQLKQTLGFISDTLVAEAVTGTYKLAKVGAEVHFHENGGDYCSRCIDQAKRLARSPR